MDTYFRKYSIILVVLCSLSVTSCAVGGKQKPRLSMFIGVDVSGSYVNSGNYEKSLDFLAHYIYAHLNGLGNLQKPNVLFVSSIGGAKPGEPKAFYPIQVFQHKSVSDIRKKLNEYFPKDKQNNLTDFNAFFEQIALTIRNKNLVLRPVSVVMLSDGVPDVKKNGKTDFRSINLHPLERLSRNITLRLLYTDPVTGKKWQTEIPRRRVKIWTQSADVMTTWNDSTIFIPDSTMTLAKQDRWLDWTKDNVDFGVRSRRVD
ncbi:MAG TPA: hypothetical protein VJ964_11480 [Balneolaceae bacterium]|nr:hypothetical protein [Balneolaceae bacterium]